MTTKKATAAKGTNAAVEPFAQPLLTSAAFATFNMIINAADMMPLNAVLQHMTRQTRKCSNRFTLELEGAASEGNLEASTSDPILVSKSSPASLVRPRVLREEGESRPATRYLYLLSQKAV